MKRKTLRLIIAVTTMSTVIVTPVMATDTNKLQQQKAAAQSEASSLQNQLSSLMTQISDLEEQLITTGDQISRAEVDLAAAQEKEQQQYEDMKLRIKYMYEEGDNTALEKILTSGSISDLLTQAEYVQSIHTYDRNMLNEYVETKQEVADLKDTLEAQMASLQETQVQYDSQKDELNSTLVAKQDEIASLDNAIQEAAAKAAAEAAAKAAAEAQARAEAEAAAQQAAASSQGSATSSSSGTTTNQIASIQDTSSNNDSSNSGGSSDDTYYEEDNSSSGNDYASSGNQSAADAIVAAAWSQIGVPYVWGGTSPGSGLDCSGLTQYCHAQAGISIPRTSGAQLAGGTIVSDPQPGDICWTPGHVAIYIGGGQMIEAQQTGVPVKVSSVRVSSYVRYW
ncbi:MAG: NlpC/P60 family protein [Hespellia sp.]|nr:NlpC/P60 family protein [Hespellia sp.]